MYESYYSSNFATFVLLLSILLLDNTIY